LAPAIGALNRTQWKYQDWLADFNGEPLRAPSLRIPPPPSSAFSRSERKPSRKHLLREWSGP